MKLTSKISKSAYKLFSLYLLVFYLVPFITHLIYPEEFSAMYQNTKYIWPLIITVFCIVTVVFLDPILPKLKGLQIFLKPFVYIIGSVKLNILLGLIFLICSIYFFNNFSISFRHKQSISQSGGIIMILFFFRTYFKAYIFLKLAKFYIGSKFTGLERFSLFIILLGFIFSLNSSWDAIFIFVLIILLIKKEKEVFSTELVKSFRSLISKYFKLILLGLVVLSVIFIGYANKIGVDNALLLFGEFEMLFLKVVKRLSMWYLSILTATVNFFEDSNSAYEPFLGTFQTFFYRIGRIFDWNISKPEIWSANRMNFLNLFRENSNPRTGASPGIFATIFYIPIFPFNFIIVSTYIIYILRKFSTFFRRRKHNVSFVGYFVLMFFLIPLFESPINIISIFDKAFIYFIFFISAIKLIKRESLI